MSGLAGVFNRDGRPAERTDLERMSTALAHRGADGAGTWQAGPVGLAHRLLWTTPESLAEHQPLTQGALAITADARLDNRAELCAAMGLADSGQPDAALILAAYAHWGAGCAERLLGDFAFALWDGRTQTLYCARDHVGARPFYYTATPRMFACASEIKGLFALPEVPRRLNERRLAAYLWPAFDDRAATFYEGVLRLPPGHCLSVTADGVRQWAYWTLTPGPELRLSSDDEYVAAFREQFAEAVRCRLRSAFPVGVMLSGGLDSSAVTAQAVALRRAAGGNSGPLHTISATFASLPKCDERPHIAAVVAAGGSEVQTHFVAGDEAGPLGNLEAVLAQQDEAFYSPNLFLDAALRRTAQAAGVRVLLDGVDGDSTVSHGLGAIAELVGRGRWPSAWAAAQAAARHFGANPRRMLWVMGVRPFVPGPALEAWRWLRRGGRAAPQQRLLRADFAQHIGWEAPAAPNHGPRTERAEHWQRLSQPVHTNYLEVESRVSAAVGIEPRSPFFDRRLMEFCLSLPAAQKIGGGWTRLILRRAMEGLLPPSIQWRADKANLTANFTRGLARYDGARLANLLAAPEPLAAYVDLAVLRTAYERFQATGGESDGLMLWKAATLAEWLRRAFGAG